MKRAFTLALTVALLGGLMFMGAAGTAAAAENNDGYDDGQSNSASVSQVQTVEQSASASSDGSVAIALGDDAEANSGSSVEQTSTNDQTATVDQTNSNIEDSLFLDFSF